MTDTDLLKQFEDESPENAPQHRGLGAGPIFILAAIVVVVAVVGIALARQNAPQPTSGAAPDFTINTFDGQAFRLSDYRGMPVVINFWASWCAPCHDEAPALQALWERYEGRVMFIGITHADEPDDSLAFMERYSITYPNAEDPRDDVTKRLYRITGVPETFVIDKDGQVARFFFSAVSEAEMAALLDELLGQAT